MFRKNSGIENFQAKEGGSFTVFSNFFYLTRSKKLRQGTILCFRKFLVGKKFYGLEGGYHDFPSKSFCLTVPKYFIGEHFGVSENFFKRKFSCIGRGITVLSKFSVSQDRNEKLCKGTLLFSRKFLVSKKFMDKRDKILRFSVEIFMSHSAEKFRKGILLFLRNFLVSKSFMDEKGGGGITFFRRKFVVSQYRKTL